MGDLVVDDHPISALDQLERWIMATKADLANDRIQQSGSPAECLAIARAMSLPMLRAVADLNHLETDGRHETLARRVVAERFPYGLDTDR